MNTTPIDRTFVTTTLDEQRRAYQQLTEQAAALERQLMQCRNNVMAVGGAVQALEHILNHTAEQSADPVPR